MQSDYSNIVIVDLFKSVVDSMRTSAEITASNETSGTYVLTTDNNLKKYDVITLIDKDYIAEAVTSTSITIIADAGIDFIGETWHSKAPYYMHGHPLEIANRLTNKNKSAVYSYQKYPLIALFQDFEEDINDELVNYATISPTVIIANLTKPDINAEERYDRNFREVLYPLYYDFLDKLFKSKFFNVMHPKGIPQTKIDRLYWGTTAGQGNEANYQNDYIDAIEINFNNLGIIETRCKNINYAI